MNRTLPLSLLAFVAVLASGCEKAPERVPLNRVSVTELHKQEVDRVAALKAAEDALKVKCADKQAEVLASARADMKKGDPKAAYDSLWQCRNFLESKASKDLMAAADMAHDAQEEKKRKQRMVELQKTAKAEKLAKKKEGVRLGMSAQDVYDSMWGKPQSVNRTVTKYGVREQWVYGSGSYLYFQDGVLESVQN